MRLRICVLVFLYGLHSASHAQSKESPALYWSEIRFTVGKIEFDENRIFAHFKDPHAERQTVSASSKVESGEADIFYFVSDAAAKSTIWIFDATGSEVRALEIKELKKYLREHVDTLWLIQYCSRNSEVITLTEMHPKIPLWAVYSRSQWQQVRTGIVTITKVKKRSNELILTIECADVCLFPPSSDKNLIVNQDTFFRKDVVDREFNIASHASKIANFFTPYQWEIVWDASDNTILQMKRR